MLKPTPTLCLLRVKSLNGNKCVQVYCTSFHHVSVFPIKSKDLAHTTLDLYFKRVGIPAKMIPDNARELTQGGFRKKCLKVQCPIAPIEAYTPNANDAESAIRELKRHYRRVMITTGAPECLWDYCIEWCAPSSESRCA